MSVPCAFPELADRPYDGAVLLAALEPLVDRLVLDDTNRSKMRLSMRELRVVLDGLPGDTLQERWSVFEGRLAGPDRKAHPPPHAGGVGGALADPGALPACSRLVSRGLPGPDLQRVCDDASQAQLA